MPYVPSEKTDGKSQDRKILDAAVEKLASEAAGKITGSRSLIRTYKEIFRGVARHLERLLAGSKTVIMLNAIKTPSSNLAEAIYEVGNKYGYEGAHLGELNYAMTRFIQRVPQIKVERGEWEAKSELRYWIYAATVKALIWTAQNLDDEEEGIAAVFEDVKDECKRRVNIAYEAEQILKSGDCYDTPYYTRLIEVVGRDGKHIGHLEVMLKRSDETLGLDILKCKIVVEE